MTVTVTVRPNNARTEVRGLPWEGKGVGYAVVSKAIDATRSDQVQYAGGAFSVARSHTRHLIDAMAARYGRVLVVHHGGVTKCVSECWKASPSTATMCQCSCAGANHGSQHPLGRVVSDSGPAGALSVASDGPREYYVYG